MTEYRCIRCKECYHEVKPDACENCGSAMFVNVRVRDVGGK